MERFCVLKDFEDIANGKWINNNKDAYRGVESIGDIIKVNNTSYDEEKNPFVIAAILTETDVTHSFSISWEKEKEGKYKITEVEKLIPGVLKSISYGAYERDLFLDLYYAIQYKISKNDEVLVLPEWQTLMHPEEYENLKEIFLNRKNVFNRKNKGRKASVLKIEFGKNNKTIKNVSPNIARLEIISKNYRNVFKKVKDKNRKKYLTLTELKNIINLWKLDFRIDDMWLLKKTLGIELANQLLQFLDEIYKTMPETEKRKENENIKNFIEKLMKLPGYYFKIAVLKKFLWHYRNSVYRYEDEALKYFIEVLEIYSTDENKEYVRNMKDIIAWKWDYSKKTEENLRNIQKWLETQIDRPALKYPEVYNHKDMAIGYMDEMIYEIVRKKDAGENFQEEYSNLIGALFRYLNVSRQDKRNINFELKGNDAGEVIINFRKWMQLHKDILNFPEEENSLNEDNDFYKWIIGYVIEYGIEVKTE